MVFHSVDAVVKDDLEPAERSVVNEDDLVVVLVVVTVEVWGRRGSVVLVFVDVAPVYWWGAKPLVGNLVPEPGVECRSIKNVFGC